MTGRPVLPVCYEDDDVLVVSKPAGLVVHPARGTTAETMVDELLAQRPSLRSFDPDRAGLVHRLDKDTSGLVVVAKTPAAKAVLAEQFADREVKKRYVALVQGRLTRPEGVIDAPIARHQAKRLKRSVQPSGKSAQTRYRVTDKVDTMSLLDVWPATGRTHQIRVHLAAFGHPVVGDATYGQPHPGLPRHFLHAAEISFRHPVTGQVVTVSDPLPADLKAFLKSL